MNEKENKDIKNKEEIKENIIIGKIKVEKNNLKQRIINSYENYKTENYLIFYCEGIENEKELKECEIFINVIKMNFTYYYNFPEEGKYTIKYI